MHPTAKYVVILHFKATSTDEFAAIFAYVLSTINESLPTSSGRSQNVKSRT